MRAPRAWACSTLLLLVVSCRGEDGSAPSPDLPSAAPSVASALPPSPLPAPAPSPTSAPTTSAEPTAAPSATPTSSDDEDDACMTAAQSMEYAKPHKAADPPFQDCAAGVFSHCGGGNGERGHLCSRALDVAKTKRVRKTKPGSCCYGGD